MVTALQIIGWMIAAFCIVYAFVWVCTTIIDLQIDLSQYIFDGRGATGEKIFLFFCIWIPLTVLAMVVGVIAIVITLGAIHDIRNRRFWRHK